jgi:hypothetical protein
MSMQSTRLFLVPILCATILPACTSLQTVKVTASPDVASASIRVDVAPATKSVESVAVRDYWMPGNAARSSVDYKTLHFGPTRSAEQEVSNSNWGASKVMVIADLPGTLGDAQTKLEIPVRGKGAKSVANVQVSSSGLTLVQTGH